MHGSPGREPCIVELIHMGILIIRDNHQWSPEQAAREIEVLIALGVTVHNALYEWKTREGWTRRPLPPD